jgi:hypothetical protein
MQTVFSNFMNALIQRLQTSVPALLQVGQDFGQLERLNATPAPSITFPCALIDMRGFSWQDESNLVQRGTGNVQIRIAVDAATATPDNFYNIEQQVYESLQGFEGPGFGKMLRTTSDTEQGEYAVRVRIVNYSVTVFDKSAMRDTTTVPRPDYSFHVRA